MYLPKHFAEADLARLHDLVETHPFGLLVAPRAGGTPEMSHLPFVLDRDRGARGTLRAHVARANPIWRLFDGRAPAVAVFQGPHAYVSPRFYASREDVPTWNYAVAHAHGAPRVLEGEQDARALLARLAEIHEQGAPAPWRVDEVPADRWEDLVSAIVVFEITIDRLEGKLKLSQNRRPEDREGAIRGLAARGGPDDLALVRLMTRSRV